MLDTSILAGEEVLLAQPPFIELPFPSPQDTVGSHLWCRLVIIAYFSLLGSGYHGCGATRCQPIWLHQVQSGQQKEFNQHGHILSWKAVFKTSKFFLAVRLNFMCQVTTNAVISNSCGV